MLNISPSRDAGAEADGHLWWFPQAIFGEFRGAILKNLLDTGTSRVVQRVWFTERPGPVSISHGQGGWRGRLGRMCMEGF